MSWFYIMNELLIFPLLGFRPSYSIGIQRQIMLRVKVSYLPLTLILKPSEFGKLHSLGVAITTGPSLPEGINATLRFVLQRKSLSSADAST
jgi:hypothetical protein